MPLVIAIDGPAGSGKSTLARNLAAELGLAYLNTGLMYRAVAAEALARKVDPDDEAGLVRAAGKLRFALDRGRPPVLLVNDRRPGPELQTPDVEAVVSTVSRHPAVRSAMRLLQRELGLPGAVVEGRDIASAVFPDAPVKIFLSAAPEVRADRRAAERGLRGPGDTRRIRKDVDRRDAMDSRTNPLHPAADAHVLETTAMSRDGVLAEALRIVGAVQAARE
jgi:CMP/dCMP kinase